MREEKIAFLEGKIEELEAHQRSTPAISFSISEQQAQWDFINEQKRSIEHHMLLEIH